MGRPPAKDLTERELEVMHVFWRHGECTATEARDRLKVLPCRHRWSDQFFLGVPTWSTGLTPTSAPSTTFPPSSRRSRPTE
jgi:hypothetical protein